MTEAPDLREIVAGLTRLARSRPGVALARAEVILGRYPRLVPIRCLAAHLARRSGALDRAAAHLDAALAEDPDAAPALAEMGALTSARGDYADAAGFYRRMLDAGHRHPDVFFNLAMAEERLGRFEEAADAYREALEAGAADATEIRARLGGVLAAAGNEEAARSEFEEALHENRACIEAMLGLGLADLSAGQFEDALGRFRKCVELQPDCAEAWKQILESRKLTDPDDPDLVAARALFEKHDVEITGKESLGFALGKAYDDLGMYDEAFEYYRRANEMKRRRLPTFDRAALEQQTEEWLARRHMSTPRPRIQRVTVTPVFIVGMPRSGTTLIDQIITAHPEAGGVGELPFFEANRQVDDLEIRSAYLERMETVGARVVTNKYPAHLRQLPLIRRVFPEARIIHAVRDPLDTCLSIYFQDFPVGNLYANDLEDIAAFYLACRALGRAWAGRGSGALEVRYETLLEDLDGMTHRLLAYCGLAWDGRCLEFTKNPRPVTTLSRWQVRQPINTGSVGRWRNYRDHLEPLLRALDITLG